MNELGQLSDLPAEYISALKDQNLVPLWPSLRGLLPPNKPSANTRATHWAYKAIRPLLLEAGKLAPIEKSERRVLVLANPGHGLEKMQASPAMYLGMQLLLPGEWAPSHKHTPNAVRMVVEGEGAWTTVEGDKCYMKHGDLILTPTGLWHEHGHDGDEPVIWLDVLDLPLIYFLETSYHINGSRQETLVGQSEQNYKFGGLAPTSVFDRSKSEYPMLRYPWLDAKAALISIAENQPNLDCIQVTYINPETGTDTENILGFYSMMLKPGQTLRLPARSPSCVFHVIEGGAQVKLDKETLNLELADTCCIPGYTKITLENSSKQNPCFLFLADESPLHRKLGVYENRG